MSMFVLGSASLKSVMDRYAAQPKQVDKALRRAIGQTIRWATREGLSDICHALRISNSILRGRVRVYLKLTENGVGRGWFGLRDVDSSRLNPIQTSSGAQAWGIGEVPHAFVQTVHGRRAMWIRQTKLRYPLMRVKLPVHVIADEALNADVFPKIEKLLQENFERELNKEILA